ncbi:ABC transporter periplasmic [Streptococcus pneumoniae]|nr:ABC transporter periplasmic [Streptococcus pneumoniae]
MGRQTARMLIRVLKGEKPENIAVELPEKLELHTNQEMADTLGIDISKLEGKE